MKLPHLLIGCAAGFSGDRTDAALPVVRELIRRGQPAVLMFETLAERTLALAQLARRNQPDAGYEPLLDDLLRPVLGLCMEHGIRIVSNFGAANPEGAARCIQRLAQRLGITVASARTYLKRVCGKLGVQGQRELFALLMEPEALS